MFIATFALAVAPRFDSFISRAAGSFTGASFSWALSQQDDTFAPLGVAAGFVSPLSPCATESTEIMRSCGGAVQGLTETQGPSEIALNRAHDGFVYFDDGSWALAPTLLDAESLDTSPSALKASVVIAEVVRHLLTTNFLTRDS